MKPISFYCSSYNRVPQDGSNIYRYNYYLQYSDNTTMFSNTSTDLEVGLNVFQVEASKLGPQASWEKTKLLHVGDGPDPSPITVGTIAICELL